jgi:signal transduction histidine kinase
MALHLAWQGPAIREALASSPEASSAARHTELLLRHLRDEVRTLSHALLPAEPGLGGLSDSINNLGALLNIYGNPAVRTHCDSGLDSLPQPLQTAAYRIAAELLNNAVRHARATQIVVQLLRHPDTLEIMVKDNGQGFETSDNSTGIGLRGVRARTDYLGGRIQIDSSTNGTCIVVWLPC